MLLQRQLLMNWLICVPIAVCWLYTEQTLLALGQTPRVSAFAGAWVRWQVSVRALGDCTSNDVR